jgi:sugar lactone lactonase YvrE
MRWFHMAWFVAAIFTVAAACAPAIRVTAPPLAASWSAAGGSGTITAQLAGPAFAVQAAPKSLADISYYTYKLYNTGTAAVTATQSTVATTCQFTSVADGTYRLRAEAFSSVGSITLGGEQLSANMATVSGVTTSYSSGLSLNVAIQLLHGTGESLAHTVTVTPGGTYGGTAAGAAWNPGLIMANPTVGNGPEALALDSLGNVWVVSDTASGLIKLNGAGAVAGTFPGGTNPFAVAVDGLNQVWVADRTGNQVRKYDNAGGLLATVAVAADPRGVAVGAMDHLWVTSNGTTTLTRLTPGLSVAGTTTLSAPAWDVATDGIGNAWVSHRAAGTVSKIAPNGTLLLNVAVGANPEGLRVDQGGNLWVACKGANQVYRVSPGGTVMGSYPATTPESVDVDPAGFAYVGCNDGTFLLYSPQGQLIHTYNPSFSISHLRLDGAGHAWLAGFTNNVAVKVTL